MAKYKKLNIYLTNEERKSLEAITRHGTGKAAEIRRANVLLMADRSEGRKRTKDVDIAAALGITPQAIHDIKENYLERKDFNNQTAEENKEDKAIKGIERKKRATPPVEAKVDGRVEAEITAIACSAPPEGRSRWTLRLIADRAVELQIIDSISHSTVGTILKKTGLSLT